MEGVIIMAYVFYLDYASDGGVIIMACVFYSDYMTYERLDYYGLCVLFRLHVRRRA